MHLSVCLCFQIDDYFTLPFTQVRDHRNANGAFKLKCQVIRAPTECFGATKQHLKASLDNPPPPPQLTLPHPHSSSNCRQVLQVLSTVICAYKLHLGLQRRRLWRRFVLCCCCTSKQWEEWRGGVGSNAAAGMLPIRRAVISDD